MNERNNQTFNRMLPTKHWFDWHLEKKKTNSIFSDRVLKRTLRCALSIISLNLICHSMLFRLDQIFKTNKNIKFPFNCSSFHFCDSFIIFRSAGSQLWTPIEYWPIIWFIYNNKTLREKNQNGKWFKYCCNQSQPRRNRTEQAFKFKPIDNNVLASWTTKGTNKNRNNKQI